MTAIPEQAFPRPLKLTVDDFLALHRAGSFEGLSKVELIEGELLTMSPQHRPHAFAKTMLAIRLFQALQSLGSDLLPIVEGTIDLSSDSAPEPDVVLTAAAFGSGLIPVASVAIAIEVADTSMPFDAGRKADLYAKHRIPEYWVLGIPSRTIEQMWLPSGGGYAERRTMEIGSRIRSVTVPGLEIDTGGLI
jgi:Uma2 family endonuclease